MGFNFFDHLTQFCGLFLKTTPILCCFFSTLQTIIKLLLNMKTLFLCGMLHRMYHFVAYVMPENQFITFVVYKIFEKCVWKTNRPRSGQDQEMTLT